MNIDQECFARDEFQGWSPIVIRSSQLVEIWIDTEDFQYEFSNEDSLLWWSFHALKDSNILFTDRSLLLLSCSIKCILCLMQFLSELSNFIVFLLFSNNATSISNYWSDLGALSVAQSFLEVLSRWISLNINCILKEWVSDILALCFNSVGVDSCFRFNNFCFDIRIDVLIFDFFRLDQGCVFEVHIVSWYITTTLLIYDIAIGNWSS